MSPIFADVGPDGAVWVIDFYSFIIQHNPTPSLQSAGVQATTGRGGAYQTENNLRDQTHGRIYRVVWKDGPEELRSSPSPGARRLTRGRGARQRQSVLEPHGAASSRGPKADGRGAGLEEARAFQHRRERGDSRALVARRHRRARQGHASGRASPRIRPAPQRHRALPANEAGRQLFFSSPVIQDPDLITRQAAFVKLLEFPTIPAIQTVVAQLPRIRGQQRRSFLNDSLTLLGASTKSPASARMRSKWWRATQTRRGSVPQQPHRGVRACHRVNGKGGDVGPILDGIAARADKAYILESLMDPNAKLAKGFEGLTISPMPPLGVLLKEQEPQTFLPIWPR
jgi:hypothetical protein